MRGGSQERRRRHQRWPDVIRLMKSRATVMIIAAIGPIGLGHCRESDSTEVRRRLLEKENGEKTMSESCQETQFAFRKAFTRKSRYRNCARKVILSNEKRAAILYKLALSKVTMGTEDGKVARKVFKRGRDPLN